MKKNIFHDILRDKGSSKYSITKTIAFIFTLLVTVYVIWVALYKGSEVDHVLIVELLGSILTLTGFKNNFGINKTNKTETTSRTISVNNEAVNDEGTF